MCIYCGTNKYRKIYEKHYGPIPKDHDGRTYEIHHIDSDHSNNKPANLTAVTLQEHYDIHYAQGDYGSCYLMASQRLNMPPEELSKLSRKCQKTRVVNGTHPFLKKEDGTSLGKEVAHKRVAAGTHHWLGDGELQKRINRDRIVDGTHHFLGETNPMRVAAAGGTHHQMRRKDGSSPASDRVTNGTHHFLGGGYQKKQLEEGRHPSQIKKTCEHCGKIVSINAFTKHQTGSRCKPTQIDLR